MSKIIAICGKICSGKTFYANQIKKKEKAIILSCDEVTSILFDNNLGENHDAMASRIWKYLLKKSVELINLNCNVILDWGFWSKKDREFIVNYYKFHNIACEWHFIDVNDETWNKNIQERNNNGLNGTNLSDYYLDEGLMKKLLSKWEKPTREEIDVWYVVKR